MKKVMFLSTLILFLFTGCYTYYDPNPPKAVEPPPPSYYYAPPVQNDTEANYTGVAGGQAYSVIPLQDSKSIETRMIDTNWISPGKVTIDNLYAGAQAEYVLRIHNGGSQATIFQVTARQPDGSAVNKLPLDCFDWVQIPKNAIYAPAKSTVEMNITVKMLKDTGMRGKTYEFWLSVIDNSQSGMVQTELCSRWIVSTRR